MEKLSKTEQAREKAIKSRGGFYFIFILLLMLIFPVLSIIIEFTAKKVPADPALIGKWFLFWAVGVRLFIAGIKQIFNPGFTARQLFHLRYKEGFILIRELGFANISLGAVGLLSLFN